MVTAFGAVLSTSTEYGGGARNVFVPAEAMTIISGTPPTRAVLVGRYGVINMPDSGGNEVCGLVVPIPDDWDGSSAFTFKVHFSHAVAVPSGDWVISFVTQGVTDGANLDVNDLAGNNETVAIPGTFAFLKVHTFGQTFTPAAADQFLGLRLFRRGAEVADDCGEDIYVLGMEFEYTADH